jgi:hypothetical protein
MVSRHRSSAARQQMDDVGGGRPEARGMKDSD